MYKQAMKFIFVLFINKQIFSLFIKIYSTTGSVIFLGLNFGHRRS
jgi:hypothetical protein